MFMQFESPSHFVLHCHYFTNLRSTLLDDLKSIDVNISSFPGSEIVVLLLSGSPKFDLNQNTKILSSSITVKSVLTTTFLKQPPVLNCHVVVFPQVFRSNFSLYSDHLCNATNDHLNDVPGFLLPAYNNHCTKCLLQKS